MGQCYSNNENCKSCKTCGDNVYEFVLGDYYLEPFQIRGKRWHELDKYNQFYRVVGEPFIYMQVEDFDDDLNALILQVEQEIEAGSDGVQHDLEKIPYVKFLDYFKEKPGWASYVNNVESSFMKLMQLDNLFFEKKVVHKRKGDMTSPPRKSKAFTDDSSADKLSPLRNVNFNRQSSQIETVGIDGSQLTLQINVDVMTLKIFALLMCKGTAKEKAAIFYDIVVGLEGKKLEKDAIPWNSKRLVESFKKLLFFSEIFPKKYQNEFMTELMDIQAKNIKIKKSGANKHKEDLDHNYRNNNTTETLEKSASQPISMM